MNPGLTILACVLGFFFSFLCVQIGAVTDQTPLTAASKASSSSSAVPLLATDTASHTLRSSTWSLEASLLESQT